MMSSGLIHEALHSVCDLMESSVFCRRENVAGLYAFYCNMKFLPRTNEVA